MIEYTFARFEAELARSMNRQSSETAATRRQLQEIEAEIRNCTHAIASEGLSSFLQTHLASEMAELQTQHRDLTEKLAASEPRAMKMRLHDTRRFVQTRLQTCNRRSGASRAWSARRSRSTCRKSRSSRQEKVTSRRVCGIGSEAPGSHVTATKSAKHQEIIEMWRLEWCRGPALHHAYHRV